MIEVLNMHDQKLYRSRFKKIIQDEFSSGIYPWRTTSGEFHQVTIDTNVDDKTGMEGEFLIDACGSYYGGTVEREIELSTYGEILFERYVKNDSKGKSENRLNFYIDDVLVLSLEGPNPWRRTEPIGVGPGKHKVKFEYIIEGNPNECSGVFDTFTVWECKPIDCLVSVYKPPHPKKELASAKTLRGYTRYQQMVESDTRIEFTAIFDGIQYKDFVVHYDEPHYFVDEFGTVYRGIFPEAPGPEMIASKKLYSISLAMDAPQKAGVGFV